MNIVITGAYGGLGKALCKYLTWQKYDVTPLTEDISTYEDTIIDKIKKADVFINCGYKDKFQSILFEKVYYHWEARKKTIINILTSGLYFGSSNESYLNDKKDLEDLTKRLRDDKKYLRITNIYPNTLENSKTPYPELKYQEVGHCIKFILQQDQDFEIFSIGLSRTTTTPRTSLI
jgi:NADP-dependent 3-hydroxy acid dehydrogenase YdfG|tara:strand:+ start:318 stop:845 length:528 start_codon:yes stop_codon:yes gene_type:complete